MTADHAALLPEDAWGTTTNAMYRVTLADETRLDFVPESWVSTLLFGGAGDLPTYTETTLKRDQRFGMFGRTLAMGALVGASLGLSGASAIFEPTPFTIKPAHVAPLEGASAEQATEEPAAYRAFKDLGRWMDSDDGRVAEMVGIGRTTPYTWQREGREPRAATAQRIYEHHATLDSLNRRLGPDGLRRWLHEGVPTRRDTLLSGGLTELDRDVHDVLFRQPADRRIDLAAAPEDSATTQLAPTTSSPARASGRRPRRPAL